jgi:hypothetical protein
MVYDRSHKAGSLEDAGFWDTADYINKTMSQ